MTLKFRLKIIVGKCYILTAQLSQLQYFQHLPLIEIIQSQPLEVIHLRSVYNSTVFYFGEIQCARSCSDSKLWSLREHLVKVSLNICIYNGMINCSMVFQISGKSITMNYLNFQACLLLHLEIFSIFSAAVKIMVIRGPPFVTVLLSLSPASAVNTGP